MTYAAIARSDWAMSQTHESYLIGPRDGTVNVVSFSSRTEIKLWEGQDLQRQMERCCGNTKVHRLNVKYLFTFQFWMIIPYDDTSK